MGEIVWNPGSEAFRQTRVYRFMQQYGLQEYQEFYQKSVEDPAWYWEAVVKDLDFRFYEPFKQVLDTSQGIAWSKWFVGGKTNLALNCIDKRKDSDRAALIWEGDGGESKTYTYSDLYREANRLAEGLEQLGVTKGDRVAIYMPMIPETCVAILACAKLGAIFLPVFSGYGADAVATRVNDCGAKILFTADGYYRRGKRISMKIEADKAAAKCPTIEKVIVAQRTGAEVSWNEAKDVHYSELIEGKSREYLTRQMDSEDPLMLIYTSGTTGKPKGAVHVHTGFPLKAAQDMAHTMDLGENDVIFWISDMGWMMGPWLVMGSLLLGATMVFFEGTPDYPEHDRLWAVVEKHGVTFLGISPTSIRVIMGKGTEWVRKHDISTLKAFGSTGEPWNPDPWMWLFQEAGEGKRPILNYSGGTEISGGILSCFPAFPLKPCAFNGPVPGMAVDVVDENCNSVRGEVGELVLKGPWPGMTRGFWQDHERYLDSYWSRWDNIWVHGDFARVDAEGFWYIEGRSDDILKIAGKRVGPAEIESVLVSHDAVMEAAAIGVPHPVKGEASVGFVILRPGHESSEKLREELKDLVAEALGKALKPEEIHVMPELPRTRNGKILRRVIKSAYLHQTMGDLSSLENPEAINHIENLK